MRWHVKASGSNAAQALLDLKTRAAALLLPEKTRDLVVTTASVAMDGEHGFAISCYGDSDSYGTRDLHVHVRAVS